MKIELSRDDLEVVIDAIGNNIEHYEGRGIQVPEMHQLYSDLDSYRQVQTVEQIREEQRENMERIALKGSITQKFFDVRPGDGNHYLCENGVQIARFDDVAKAERVRDLFMAAEATRLQRTINEVYGQACRPFQKSAEQEQGVER